MGGATPDDSLAPLPPGALVVTANRRLAAHLTERHDAARLAAGARAWSAPDILPLNAWVARCAEAAWPERGGLTDAHALLLWERLVAASEAGGELLRPAAAARQAWAAWQLARAWEVPLDGADAGAETRVFKAWADAYRAACRAGGWDDPADRVRALAGWLRDGTVAAPPVAWFAGFDRIAPDLRAVMAALARKGCDVREWPAPERAGTACRVTAEDRAREARLAARWARQRAERGARVGIVVPDLAAYRTHLERALTEQMDPGRAPGAEAPAGVNLSLGLPLSAEPVVAGALALLAVDRRPLPVATLGMVMRAPWLGAAEGSARALAAARILSRRRADTPLAALLPALGDDPALAGTARRLRRWLAALAEQGGKRPPSAWARAFWELLDVIGWPGDVAPDSRAYQAVARLGELMRELAALDPVADVLERHEAVARLSALAGTTIFQPQGGAAPVQVMGVLEAAGMAFDALWLMGFSDTLWPRPPAPNPFLPVAVQRDLEMPRSGPAAELAFARAATGRLLAAAPEVVASHPREADGECGPSPLLAHLPEADPDALGLAPDLCHGRRMAASAALAEVADPAGPPLAPGELGRGGTSLFADQAACPFKAFAAHRLGARLEAEAEPGLDRLERGNLAHAALELAWQRLGGHAALAAAAASGELAALLDDAAAQAVEDIRRRTGLAEAFVRLERRRVAALLAEWLGLERDRAPFTVVATEQEITASAGGVTVRARIDRIDRLADGGEVLIDYKTGSAGTRDWFGERPDAPQLPLYAVGMGRPPAGVAFGRVKRGACGFTGLTEGDGVLPGVKGYPPDRLPDGAPPEWAGLTPGWRVALDRLGAAFAAGDAAVDPKAYPATCRYCDLDPLCRVWEHHADPGEENGDD